MNREIKFRGKTTGLGDFIEGDIILWKKWENNLVWVEHIAIVSHQWCNMEPNKFIEVNPETVGQFTGLTDKNGKEIYEGDILKDGKGGNGVVIFASPQFVVQVNNEIYSLAEGKVNVKQLEYTEVIGNIHDNQELL